VTFSHRQHCFTFYATTDVGETLPTVVMTKYDILQ